MLQSPDKAIPLDDDQLMYIRMNPRTHTPFGLGPLEVAFETVNSFLSAQRFAGKLASNAVVQYALWLNEATPAEHERLIRWWQDEIEGTGRVPVLSTEQKPEVLRFGSGTDADLRMEWQTFLIRMVANAFRLPPMLLGLENDVNRASSSEFGDEAFRGADRAGGAAAGAAHHARCLRQAAGMARVRVPSSRSSSRAMRRRRCRSRWSC